jgi:PKD repeat protein
LEQESLRWSFTTGYSRLASSRFVIAIASAVDEDASVDPSAETWFLRFDVTTAGVADFSVVGATDTSKVETAKFKAAKTQGTAGFQAQFSDLSADNPTSWLWSFGDGGSSLEQNPVYAYQSEGTYTVSLTASNADGSDTITRVDYIAIPEPTALVQQLAASLGVWFLSFLRQSRSWRRHYTATT